MRTVVAYQLIALDGVAEEPGDRMSGVDETVLAHARPRHLRLGWSGATAVGGPAADHVRRLTQFTRGWFVDRRHLDQLDHRAGRPEVLRRGPAR